MELSYPSGFHEVREEYLIYSSASFFADVGGYLGLLLGQSLYSVLCELVDAVMRKKKEREKCAMASK